MTRRIALGATATLLAVTGLIVLHPWPRSSNDPPSSVVPVVAGPTHASRPVLATSGQSPIVMAGPAIAPPPLPSPSPLPPGSHDIAPLSGLLRTFPNMRAQLEHLGREARDPVWAATSEQLLADSYAVMPNVGGGGRALRIYCGSQHCVAFGDLSNGPNSGTDELQSIEHIKAMMTKGYWSDGSAFGLSPFGDRGVFMMFYRRGEPTTLS